MSTDTSIRSYAETGRDYDLLVNGINTPFTGLELTLERPDSDSDYYEAVGSLETEALSEYTEDLFVRFDTDDSDDGDDDGTSTFSMFLSGHSDSIWLTGVEVERYTRRVDVGSRTVHRIEWSAAYVRFPN